MIYVCSHSGTNTLPHAHFLKHTHNRERELTPPRILHDVHPKLDGVPRVDLARRALLRALAETLVVDERTIAALGVLQVELANTQVKLAVKKM